MRYKLYSSFSLFASVTSSVVSASSYASLYSFFICFTLYSIPLSSPSLPFKSSFCSSHFSLSSGTRSRCFLTSASLSFILVIMTFVLSFISSMIASFWSLFTSYSEVPPPFFSSAASSYFFLQAGL